MKWPLLTLMCLMPFVASVAVVPDLIVQGNDKKAHGDLKGAIAAYTAAIAQNPKDAKAYMARATVLGLEGNFDAAMADDTQAITLDPKSAMAFSNRGNARMSKGDLAGAMADYTQAIALDPKHVLAFNNRGNIKNLQKDYRGAIADYTQALTLDPKNAAAYYNRAGAERSIGDYADAEADYSQALVLNKIDVPAYLNRAILRIAQHNWDGATADLNTCLTLLPEERQVYPRVFLWVIASEHPASNKTTLPLTDYLNHGSSKFEGTWPWQIAKFLAGQVDEATFLASAKSFEAKKDKGQVAQAYYYAGLKQVLVGDKAAAVKFFKQCQQSGNRSLHEFVLAREAMKSLGGQSK